MTTASNQWRATYGIRIGLDFTTIAQMAPAFDVDTEDPRTWRKLAAVESAALQCFSEQREREKGGRDGTPCTKDDRAFCERKYKGNTKLMEWECKMCPKGGDGLGERKRGRIGK